MEGRADEREDRIARNEVAFRRVNEAIEPASSDPGVHRYVCECGRLGCTETIPLTRKQYEAVRTSFERFLLAPGHETALDELTEDHGAFHVVTKSGAAAEIAGEDDPRETGTTT